MQKFRDLFKSVFALRATVICLSAVILSVAVMAIALNLAVYEVTIDDNGTAGTYKVYSKTVEGVLAETGLELRDGDQLSCRPEDSVRECGSIKITRAKTVIVALDDQEKTVKTVSGTVEELVKELEIPLGDENLLITPAETPVSENLKVEIIAKAYREVKESEVIPYETKSVANSSMKKGTDKVKTAGVNGEKVKTYKVLEHNGKVIEKELLSEEVTKKPVSKVVEYGTMVTTVTNRSNTSGRKGDFSYSKVLEMTAYSYSGGGLTATGKACAVGRVAVDPRVIPLGTRLYIEAWDGKSWTYGYAVAEDTGGAIKGHKIDLYRNTESECINFGVRKAKVYILD